jgi:hypothetical protein
MQLSFFKISLHKLTSFSVLDESLANRSPFSESRYLQTLCALLVASDLSLCEKILHFLLFDAVQIRELSSNCNIVKHFVFNHLVIAIMTGATREIMRSIGISDLLKNFSQRSGSLRVHAFSAILLTHLSMPGSISISIWFVIMH